jgi:DNA-binding transcriptional regulator YhcF (GntR family)
MILRQVWPEDERIPSVREMAMDLQVNPNTVNKGYAYLQDRELIYNQRGIGYFVAPGALAKTRALKRSEFFATELPHVYKTMALLDIPSAEIVEGYEEYRRKIDEKENK